MVAMVSGGLLDGVQQVEDPVFPRILIAHRLKQAVVVGLGAYDVAAQVEHRNVEQAFLDQIQHVEDAPGAAVAVVERVDALELVMDQRHLDQRSAWKPQGR
jgi:Tfp pilus assembly protein PilN